MGQSAGLDGEHFSADPERPALVSGVAALISEWDGLLSTNPLPGDPRAWQLAERSGSLDPRLRAVGFGGVAHHLSELRRLVEAAADSGRLRAQLEVVRELTQQAAQSLPPAAPARASQPPDAAAAEAGMAPPPLLTMFREKAGVAGAPAAAAAASSAPAPARGFTQPRPPPSPAPPPMMGFGHLEGPPPVLPVSLPAPEAPPNLHNPQAGPAPVARREPDPADPLRPDAPDPIVAGAVRAVGAGFAEAPKPAPFRPEGSPGPNLLVRSMLGLRAFGKPKDKPEGAAGAAPGAERSQPSLLNLKRGARAPTPREPSRASHPAPHPGQPPHLRGPLAHGSLPEPRPIDVAPPPMVNEGRSGLPPLPLGPAGLPAADQRGGSSPNIRDLLEHARDRDSKHPRAALGRRGRSRRPERKPWDWRLGLLVGAGFVGLVAVIVALAVRVGRKQDERLAPAGSASGGAQASASSSAAPDTELRLPPSKLMTDNERVRSLIQQVHGRGKETPELRALLDEQASVAARALSPEGCAGSALECAALAKIKDVLTGGPVRVVRRRRSAEGWKSKWLAGLKMPDLPVEDDPRVQRRFEFYTENPVGRETFQQMLFRCGAHKDLIQSALIRRGLPGDLIAVAFAESGCAPQAKSPAGAEGLWQFIPDAARAYHLRIIEGIVDERHSPAKSTEAAVRYFSDLKTKFEDWDLCFAAYNMGPFGLAARIERAGGNVGFWDLVDSDLIPDETADYAPSIQAIALILANLQKLKFGAIQMRAPQITADLEVPPNTRLSLIARAAATSVAELRRLNLDLKSDRTPNLPNFAVQVPKDVVWQARDTLQELLKNKDEADLCTSPAFDWGRQRFTQDMAKNCQRQLSASPDLLPADPAAAPGADILDPP